MPQPDEGRMQAAWAVHQVETTVDFARGNRVLSWILGGLNFQIEHHLFPQISHVHYPALAPLVEETCQEFGVRYIAHKTDRASDASHYRWSRQMGSAAALNETVKTIAVRSLRKKPTKSRMMRQHGIQSRNMVLSELFWRVDSQ